VLITHIARVYTSVGMHMQAAKAYAQLLGISTLDADTRMKLVAEYAIALSHFDSNSADIQVLAHTPSSLELLVRPTYVSGIVPTASGCGCGIGRASTGECRAPPREERSRNWRSA
jgi:hypothetical protein